MKHSRILFLVFLGAALKRINMIQAGELQSSLLCTYQVNRFTNCVVKVLEQMKHDMAIIDVSIINGNGILNTSYLMQELQGIRWLTQDFVWDNQLGPVNGYIIMSKDYEELEQGLGDVSKSFFWNPTAKFTILFDSLYAVNLENVTSLLMKHNMYNVSVIRPTEDTEEIYTFNSETDSCSRPKNLSLHSKCTEINDVANIFQKRKFKIFKNCTFKVITHNDWPFVSFDSPTTVGLDQFVLKEFEAYQHVSIDAEPYVQTDRFEKVIRNFTYTSMLQKVQDNAFEAAVGGYTLFNSRARNFSFSYPFIIDDMALIVRRPELLPMWQAVFKYGYAMTLMSLCSFVILSIATVLMSIFPKRKKDMSRDILIVFGYFTGRTYEKNIKQAASSRILFSSMLFLVFLLSYILQGYLVGVRSNVVTEFLVRTPHEAQTKCTGIVPILWRKEGTSANLHYCTTNLECLTSVASSGECSYTVVSTTHFDVNTWMLVDSRCHLILYKIKETLTIIPRTIYFRRGSVFVIAFDKFFERFIGAGLWEMYKRRLIHMERVKCKSVHKTYQEPLKLNDLGGAFLILPAGYCLSIAVFILECMHK